MTTRRGEDYIWHPTMWDELGLLDYAFVPRYRSAHFENKTIDLMVAQYERERVPYQTLSDGEAIVIDA
ncbi:MAG: hypothetical protein ACR2JX_10125 [Mycobacteriales bacterium]